MVFVALAVVMTAKAVMMAYSVHAKENRLREDLKVMKLKVTELEENVNTLRIELELMTLKVAKLEANGCEAKRENNKGEVRHQVFSNFIDLFE